MEHTSPQTPQERIAQLEAEVQAQREELALMRTIFDLSQVGVYVTDGEGVVLKVNEVHEKITGHTPEEVLGKRTEDIPRGAMEKSGTLAVLRTGKPAKLHQSLKNGHSYFVYAFPSFDAEGKIKYVISNLVDTTEINNVKKQLQQSESEKQALTQRIMSLEKRTLLDRAFISTSESMASLLETCTRVAAFDSTVLITGESGTGKELIADYIFTNSLRTEKPFVKINCSSIPEALLESELFGYEAGSFTGANSKGKKGLFEIADHGTVFLDEVGELPMTLQSKLLRFLQEGEFLHIGGIKPIKVDVRLIAATNRDLEKMIERGAFRQDLYYRLNVIPIHIPPLSKRREDIPPLIQSFLREMNERYGMSKFLSSEVVAYLSQRDYPGNVRELKNLVERIFLLSPENKVTLQDLSLILQENVVSPAHTLQEMMDAYEKEILRRCLSEYRTTSRVGEVLRVSQPTISRKLRKYRIPLPDSD